jgi:hypothetical protein
MTKLNLIRGVHCVDGFHAGRGAYRVTITSGRIFDADFGEELFVQKWGNDAPILTNGVWEFWPDDADLDRLGLTPKQMIAG